MIDLSEYIPAIIGGTLAIWAASTWVVYRFGTRDNDARIALLEEYMESDSKRHVEKLDELNATIQSQKQTISGLESLLNGRKGVIASQDWEAEIQTARIRVLEGKIADQKEKIADQKEELAWFYDEAAKREATRAKDNADRNLRRAWQKARENAASAAVTEIHQ